MTTTRKPRRRERRPPAPDSTATPSSPSSRAFRHVKAKALRALDDNSVDPSSSSQSPCHVGDVDKSSKGSIDVPILNLVRRLNEHPDYATTSSCSGRISLFDPTGGGGCGGGGGVIGAAAADTGETGGDECGGSRADRGDGASEARNASAATVDYQSKRNVPSRTSEKHAGATGGGGVGGKGRGTWLLSSHGPVTLEQLELALTPPPSSPPAADPSSSADTSTPLTLKFEPLVMHVACASAESARILLSTALGCGYRESGTVFGSKGRITVAIRSHSTALAVPLSTFGPLRPGREYLGGLVGVMNDRFERNAEKTIRLEEAIERALFPAGCGGGDDDDGRGEGTGSVKENPSRGSSGKHAIVNVAEHVAPAPPHPSSSSGAADTATKSDSDGNGETTSLAKSPEENTTPVVEATFRPLPPLRLWGHAAVAVPRDKTAHSAVTSSPSSVVPVDVLAIGGYGVGPPPPPPPPSPEGDDPDATSNSSSSSASCRRFDSVFRLSRDGNGLWDDRWRRERILLPPREEGKCESAIPDVASVEDLTKTLPFEASLVTFPPLQGHAACLLPLPLPGSSAKNAAAAPPVLLVAVFGGRSGGPARAPSNDLYLYCHRHHHGDYDDDDEDENSVGGGGDDGGVVGDVSESSARSFFCRPVDVRGALPRPRWGHTFTAIISSDDGSSMGDDRRRRHLAVVVGGMDESKRAFDDAHVLTLVSSPSSSSSSSLSSSSGTGKTWSSSFLWQELDVTGGGLDRPLFYHASASEVPAYSSGRVRRRSRDDTDRGDGLGPHSDVDVPREDDEWMEHPPGIFIFGGLCDPAELFPRHDSTREEAGSVLRVFPSHPCNGGTGDEGEDCGSTDGHPTDTVMATCAPIRVRRSSCSPRSDGDDGGGTSPISPAVAAMLGGFGASACTLWRVTTTCDEKLPSCTFESTLSGYVAVTGGIPLDVAGTGLSQEAGDDEIPLAVLRVSQQREGSECGEAGDRDGTTTMIPCRVRWKVGDPRTESSLRPAAAVDGGRDEDNLDASFAPPPPLNLGALVHHAALSIGPSPCGPQEEDVDVTSSHARLSDIVLVGGGVPSFAFGSTFASCCSVTLHEVDA